MELLKAKDNLTFQIGEVTFIVRQQMTVRDKFALDMIGEYKDGIFTVQRGDVMTKLVELFVVGWEGVTEDGKPVPYSYATFMERFPSDMTQDIIIKLGGFVMETIGLLKKDEDQLKNA